VFGRRPHPLELGDRVGEAGEATAGDRRSVGLEQEQRAIGGRKSVASRIVSSALVMACPKALE
jgi:hypothetical protein